MKPIFVIALAYFFCSYAYADNEASYKVKSVNGACAGIISQATLELIDGKPRKLIFPSATMTFDKSSKIEKKPKIMLLNEDGRLTKVSFQLLSDNTISFKVVAEGEECSGMNIIFSSGE
jgi:hypothetical protein